jgi:outer membrane protein assembly factor BamE
MSVDLLRRRLPLAVAALALLLGASGCVYRLDIQQGNLLDADDVAQVEVGMTRSQVRYLLGTPMVQDTFHDDRWDYIYYLRRGRFTPVEESWVIVWFDGDTVSRIEVEANPRG